MKVPEQKKYVTYTQNYMSQAIVTTLLPPDDPRSADLFSDNAVTLTSDKHPYLSRLVVDRRGQVYDRLRGSLPDQETREYLAKVVTFRKQFVSPAENTPC